MSRQYVSERRAVSATGDAGPHPRTPRSRKTPPPIPGYHAMTISGLARRAGVSPQTIYNAVGSTGRGEIKALYDRPAGG